MITPRFLIYLALILFVGIFGLFVYRKLQQQHRFLTFLVLFTFVSEVTSRFFSHLLDSSMPVYYLTVLIQLVFFWKIYRTTLRRKWLDFLFLLAIVLVVINTAFIQSMFNFPTNSLNILSLVVITASLFDLKRLLTTTEDIALYRIPNFWLNIGNILFFSVTFFAFGLMNLAQTTLPYWIYYFIYGANIILYTCYGLAIYFAQKKSTI